MQRDRVHVHMRYAFGSMHKLHTAPTDRKPIIGRSSYYMVDSAAQFVHVHVCDRSFGTITRYIPRIPRSTLDHVVPKRHTSHNHDHPDIGKYRKDPLCSKFFIYRIHFPVPAVDISWESRHKNATSQATAASKVDPSTIVSVKANFGRCSELQCPLSRL